MAAIELENISKLYKLGMYGADTLRDEVFNFFARLRGKAPINARVGTENRLNSIDDQYVWALKDINFSIEQGDIVGIIGKNGAGKSTLLKLLSKITAPTTGTIKIKGRIASLLEVGTGMHPELTGRENIYLNGAILGMTKNEIKRKFDDIVDFAGIAKYIETPIKRYSSGMSVRLGFAIAAFLEPEILVVDEVLAVGDAEFQKKAIGKMQDVSQGEGRTVLFVSHNMSAIKNLCKHGIVMERGTVAFNGNVLDATDFYLKSNEIKVTSDKKIIECITQCLPTFHVEKIEFNGTEYCTSTVTENQHEIEVKIEGSTDVPQKIDLMLILRNTDGTPLASLAEGHYKGKIEILPEGKFSFVKRVKLPKYMFEGEIMVGLYLHRPNIEYIMQIHDCIKINFYGSGVEFGKILKTSEYGLIGLETI